RRRTTGWPTNSRRAPGQSTGRAGTPPFTPRCAGRRTASCSPDRISQTAGRDSSTAPSNRGFVDHGWRLTAPAPDIQNEETMSDNDMTTKLYFGPWYRRSPFFEATRRAGCAAYDIYNKMYLPAEYDDPNVEYQALNDGVTLWDVGVERTVQIAGPDADRLADLLTCRDLTKCAVKQCKYMLVTAPSGGIVNDPVLVHPEENVWWMQLADSDGGLYALGVLSQSGLDAEVTYPDVHPVQVQGPLAARTLAKLVGESIFDIRYYWCEHFTIGDIPVVVTRTGWSAVPGFEVNLLDGTRGDELWDAIMGAGE